VMSDTTLAPDPILCNIAHLVSCSLRLRTLQFAVLGGFATRGVVRRKASKPKEFGKMVEFQEAENQIVTHIEEFAEGPADLTLSLSSVQADQKKSGRTPLAVAADARFYSRENERAGQALGVRRMLVPDQKTTSREQKRLQHQYRGKVEDWVGGSN